MHTRLMAGAKSGFWFFLTVMLALFFRRDVLCNSTRTDETRGIDEINALKSDLWESSDTDWVNGVVVNGTCRLNSDETRLQFIRDFDPDIIDWYYGPGMNPGDLCRSRGIAVSSPEEYEYQEALQFTRGNAKKFFTGNGIALLESGETAFYNDFGGGEFMCHNSPRWRQVVQQGLLRVVPYGDCVTQDNISSTIGKGWGTYCDWCNGKFIEYMKERFTPAEREKMDFNAGPFNIRAYLQSKRKSMSPEQLVIDPLLHEYIRFQHVAHIKNWVTLSLKIKAAAVKAGRPVPAVYGNQWGAQGIWPLGTLLSPHLDVVWVEQALYQPYVDTGEFDQHQPFAADRDRQAWSSLVYKLGGASGYFRKPIWTVLYPDIPILTSIALAEARANGGLMVQCYGMDESKMNGGVWDAHKRHAQFAGANRELFVDRESRADVALVYSLPSVIWRSFSSLTVPHAEKWEDIRICDQMKEFSHAARILEDSHVPYDILILGHPDFFDDRPFFERMDRYSTIIVPGADAVSDRQAVMLGDWVSKGGSLIFTGNSGICDEELRPRDIPVFRKIGEHQGDGTVINAGDTEGIRSAVKNNKKPLLETDLPQSVWLNIWKHGAGPMTSVQMVNYDADVRRNSIRPVRNCTLRLRSLPSGGISGAVFLAPGRSPLRLPLTEEQGYLRVTVPELEIFGTVVFCAEGELAARHAAAETGKLVNRLRIAARCPGENGENNPEIIAKAGDLVNAVQGKAFSSGLSKSAAALDSVASELKGRVEYITEQVARTARMAWGDAEDLPALRRFDFGGPGIQGDWERVSEDTYYSEKRGFGWISGEGRRQGINKRFSPALYSTGYLWSENPSEFRIDIDDGEYIVTVLTGDDARHIRVGATYVDANGAPALTGNRSSGGFLESRTFRTVVTGGSLILRFYGYNTGVLYANPLDPRVPGQDSLGIGWLINALLLQRPDQPMTEAAERSLKESDLMRKAALRRWMISGPFENESWEGMETKYPPERKIGLAASFSGKEDATQWTSFTLPEGLAPRIPFEELFEGRENAAAFAVTNVKCIRETRAILISSFSQIGECFVNGERVTLDETAAGLLPAEDRTSITLKQGWNTILIKSLKMWGKDWSAWAGLLSEAGELLSDVEISPAGPD